MQEWEWFFEELEYRNTNGLCVKYFILNLINTIYHLNYY